MGFKWNAAGTLGGDRSPFIVIISSKDNGIIIIAEKNRRTNMKVKHRAQSSALDRGSCARGKARAGPASCETLWHFVSRRADLATLTQHRPTPHAASLYGYM